MPQKSSNLGMLFFYRVGRQHRIYPILQFPDVFFKAFDLPVPLRQGSVLQLRQATARSCSLSPAPAPE